MEIVIYMKGGSRFAPAKHGEFVHSQDDREYIFRGRALKPDEFNAAFEEAFKIRDLLPYPIKVRVNTLSEGNKGGDAVASLRSENDSLRAEIAELNLEIEHLINLRAREVNAPKKARKSNTK